MGLIRAASFTPCLNVSSAHSDCILKKKIKKGILINTVMRCSSCLIRGIEIKLINVKFISMSGKIHLRSIGKNNFIAKENFKITKSNIHEFRFSDYDLTNRMT